MRYRLQLPSALALSAFALAACADENPTQPNLPTESSATRPELAVAGGTWVTKTPPPRDQGGPAVAVVTDAALRSTFYIIGGYHPYAGGPPLSRVKAYDVATDSWLGRRSMPEALKDLNGAGVIGRKIYVAGGHVSDWRTKGANATLYVYNTVTNTWTRKHDMPAGGFGGSTGVIDGKLYVVTSTAAGAAFFRYDPGTDRWVTLPAPAHAGLGVVLKDKFYLAGTYSYNDLAVYDPVTNRWTAKAPPPPRLYVTAAALGGQLYLINQQIDPNGTSFRRISLVYDPGSDSWSERTPPPTAFVEAAASKVFLNGQPRLQVLGTYSIYNFQYIP